MKIYFITGNEKKAAEVAQIIPEVERVSMDLMEIQSLDPHEVLGAKLDQAVLQMPGKHLVVEDVTYSVQGLNGLPGTLVKWFIDRVGPEGIFDMAKDKDCTTEVAANIGYVDPEGNKTYVSGVVRGRTVEPVKGGGFFFDEIFIPEGQDLRYSEMTQEHKNLISHRALAWNNLKELLDNRS